MREVRDCSVAREREDVRPERVVRLSRAVFLGRVVRPSPLVLPVREDRLLRVVREDGSDSPFGERDEAPRAVRVRLS